MKEQEFYGPGEVIAETCVGFRNLVARGEMSREEALGITNEVIRNLSILAIATGMPFERGSTQLSSLVEEGRRIREAKQASRQVPVEIAA